MKKLMFIVGLLLPFGVYSQQLIGAVINNNNEPLIGANVYWEDNRLGVTTDEEGKFEIDLTSESS